MSMLGDMLADVPAPFPVPIGLRLSQTARAVERTFDEALGEAGGTLPVWLILLNLEDPQARQPAGTRRSGRSSRGHADAPPECHGRPRAGHRYPRRRQPASPGGRAHRSGRAAFALLRDTAIAFDAKLRAGLADTDLATLSTLLRHLAANVGAGKPHRPGPTWPTAARSNRSGSDPRDQTATA